MTDATAHEIVYQPSNDIINNSNMADYIRWLAEQDGRPTLAHDDYHGLHAWSVAEPAAFWNSLWDYFGLIGDKGNGQVLDTLTMPGARWFADARINYAENLLHKARGRDADHEAIVSLSEKRQTIRLTYAELWAQVGALQAFLEQAGVKPGDRVAGVVAHTHEPMVALLACASIGAIWSSASPDFGVSGIVDRFAQIEPKALIIVDGYQFGGQYFDRLEYIDQLRDRIPTIEQVVVTDNTGQAQALPESKTVTGWDRVIHQYAGCDPVFNRGEFDRPIYIVFSSGTTGTPKCIVHSTGGVLIQHAKEEILHGDIGRDDVFFYYTTCGWMMWNWHVTGLFTGATLVTYDGSPGYPNLDYLWAMAEAEGVTHFGTSAKWLGACRNRGLTPGQSHDLSALRAIFSTGSPLLDADYDWVYTHVRNELMLGSIAGGTDIVSSFVGCCPILPVRRGEIQCRLLGVAAEAFNDDGQPVLGQRGELVCTQPIPSMPVKFWNDPGGKRYHDAYFNVFPGIWAHGDYIAFFESGGAIIYGRSDATLNIGGVRIGTAEIYRLVEPMKEVADCLVAPRTVGENSQMVMLVVTAEGYELDQTLQRRIRQLLKEEGSPRHAPRMMLEVSSLPYTRSGKKVEVAVSRVLNGDDPEQFKSVANPESLTELANHPQLKP